MALFDNTVVARTQPEFALEVLAEAVRGIRGLYGTRGEAKLVARYLLNELRPPSASERSEGEGGA